MNWIKVTPEMKLPEVEVLAMSTDADGNYFGGNNYFKVGYLRIDDDNLSFNIICESYYNCVCEGKVKCRFEYHNVSHYCLIEPPNEK